MILRPYQQTLVDRVRDALRRGRRSVLMQSPTGSGKSVIFAHIIGGAAAAGWPCWLIVHRGELVRQVVDTFKAAGISCGIAAAGHRLDSLEPVQVCMVQSMKSRSKKLGKPRLIVIDECHHATSRTYADLLSQYPDAIKIGVTATPERLDGQGLGGHFEELIDGPSVQSLIADGWLSKYRIFDSGKHIDLSDIHITAGDYNKQELAAKMDRSTVVGDSVAEYQKHAAGLRALCFAYSISSSMELAERFKAAGVPAVHIDGTTPDIERRAAIARFRTGDIKVVSNVDLFGEGLDLPGIEAVFLLRSTRSLGLYLQQVGRALRPAEGKDAALIFDHVGNRIQHGLPDDDRIWGLTGKKSRSGLGSAPQKQCPKCYSIQAASAATCRNCGHVWTTKDRNVSVSDGELQELTAEQITAARNREQGIAGSLEELQAIGRARGYHPRWALHVWEARHKKLETWQEQALSAKQADAYTDRRSELSVMADTWRPTVTVGKEGYPDSWK